MGRRKVNGRLVRIGSILKLRKPHAHSQNKRGGQEMSKKKGVPYFHFMVIVEIVQLSGVCQGKPQGEI